MANGGPDPKEESIGDLVGRLVEDGRAYAEAEIELYKTIARYRAVRARKALVALAIGWFLLFAAMTALVIAAMVSLSQAIGPLLAGFVVGVPLAAGGYALARYGWTGVKGLGQDPLERAAIERGEQRP
ncbi:phage holin family protein [Sphingosinicella sp. LHD-64]|uniref:phage holin family protein n=1 Tax=Sphingosinicella sp. LHD-64 TaxID=3072139 RepID=UPI00280C5E20|nr:phage holin family protein [Sphingosinicella sp. LHD-64]MDQ8757743.1 phage holin family protein [Sphingosinicella sp. LHD-64]